MSAVLGAALLLATTSWCQEARVTGYSRLEYGPTTFDGTPIGTPEPIAAASWNIPIDSVVVIPELGSFRVADRGMLGSSGWVDIAVWSRAEAYELTSTRTVCVYPPA
ncbi:MAG TPA: hypothetical protein VNG35_02605 [Gemmatimonadales bacterium]|nr:hypothetical protein [Gemmatimonadales bacterium]